METFRIEIGADGQLAGLYNKNDDMNYLLSDSSSHLIRMRFEEEILAPHTVAYKPEANDTPNTTIGIFERLLIAFIKEERMINPESQ